MVKYKPLSTNCASCHGDVHLGQFKQQCEQCHVSGGLKFDHATSSFPLAGKHLLVACEKCHRLEKGKFPAGTGETIRYKLSASTCASCHADIHRGQFTQDCAACHSVNGFLPTTFKHAKSNFPLAGAHANLLCEKCHKPEIVETPPPPTQFVRYKLGSIQCGTCHEDAHNGRFGKDCARCHSDQEWKTINRAFHKKGVFPLTGRHYDVPCAACHWEGQTAGTPTRCYDCHWIRRQDDLYRTRLGTNCEECHKPTSWTAVQWNHESVTGVAIGTQHRLLGCESCHQNQNFTTAGANCFSCHRENYDQTTAPSHKAAGFPTTCEFCHRPSDVTWQATGFNHSTIFPLLGQHATASCQSCHRNNVYTGLPHDCLSCHRSNYDATTNPNHRAAGFPTTCEGCHNAGDPNWNAPNFNHSQYFKLVGAHATLGCESCHKNGQYQGTPRDCYGCHRNDYQGAKNPNHVASGFSTHCDSCHSASAGSWHEAATDHSFFKLVGVHKTLSCESCHKNGVFQGTPRECYGCHKPQYDATRNPNHRTAGFGTNCHICHKASDVDWHQARFDHKQIFPLVGVHATVDCAACHKNGIYSGTPRDCYGCHKAQYDSTNDPNHKAASFPTTCQNCHKASDASWNQGVFNHTWFPITSGHHAGFSCSQCHPNSGDFAIFTCTNCHTKSATDSQHSGVGGYSYNSQACYSCHPRGQGE